MSLVACLCTFQMSFGVTINVLLYPYVVLQVWSQKYIMCRFLIPLGDLWTICLEMKPNIFHLSQCIDCSFLDYKYDFTEVFLLFRFNKFLIAYFAIYIEDFHGQYAYRTLHLSMLKTFDISLYNPLIS